MSASAMKKRRTSFKEMNYDLPAALVSEARARCRLAYYMSYGGFGGGVFLFQLPQLLKLRSRKGK